MLFNSQSDTDDYNLIDFYRWRILVIEDEGALSLQKHPADDPGDDSGIVVTEDRPYLLTVVRGPELRRDDPNSRDGVGR